MLCSLRFICTMELCGQSTTPTETYDVSGSEIGEAYLHIHLSRAIVLLGLGVGLCVTHLNHKDKLTWLSILFALVCFPQHLLQVPWCTFSPVWSSMIAFAMFLYILGMLFTSCFHSRIQVTSKNRRRTTLGSHIWTRRKIFWRHARLSRESYIRHAMNNKFRRSLGDVIYLAQRFRSRSVERQILAQLQLRRYQVRRSVFEFARREGQLSNYILRLVLEGGF